jgi:hypothetical protein
MFSSADAALAGLQCDVERSAIPSNVLNRIESRCDRGNSGRDEVEILKATLETYRIAPARDKVGITYETDEECAQAKANMDDQELSNRNRAIVNLRL